MKFEIDLKNTGAKSLVKLNGKRIERLRGIQISTFIEDATRITLHFTIPDEIKGEVESDLIEIMGLGDEFKEFIKQRQSQGKG